jgi:hypothetical protein
MIATHGVPLSLYRDRHSIFQRNDPTGPSPNSSPENNLPPNSDAPSNNSVSRRSPPTLRKPRAASSAPGAPARTVELAHHLDGRLHVYRGDQLLLALPRPLEECADRRP